VPGHGPRVSNECLKLVTGGRWARACLCGEGCTWLVPPLFRIMLDPFPSPPPHKNGNLVPFRALWWRHFIMVAFNDVWPYWSVGRQVGEGCWASPAPWCQAGSTQLLFLQAQFEVLFVKYRFYCIFWLCEPPRPALAFPSSNCRPLKKHVSRVGNWSSWSLRPGFPIF